MSDNLRFSVSLNLMRWEHLNALQLGSKYYKEYIYNNKYTVFLKFTYQTVDCLQTPLVFSL